MKELLTQTLVVAQDLADNIRHLQNNNNLPEAWLNWYVADAMHQLADVTLKLNGEERQ